MKFIYKAMKRVKDDSLFIGCYSSLEKFEEVLKKHSDGFIKDSVGPLGREPSYYVYFLTDKNTPEISKEELYKNYDFVVVQKVEIDIYDPIYNEAIYMW